MTDEPIAALDAVPTDSTLLFRVRDADGDRREAFLIRVGGDGGGDDTEGAAADVRAWLNYCQHFTHIRLDKGGGATVRDGEVVCRNHGAMFDADDGRCTFGPCEGAYLTALPVTVRDGAVYLADEDHDFLGLGPAEDDGDLTSTSNVEF